MSTATGHRISTIERLREIVPAPEPTAFAILKQKDALDEQCRAVIAAAPFMLLATAGADGPCDVSPRGDAPGFVQVLDERTIAIPDRPGNRRLDSLENILGNGHAATLFMVPNMDRTLRINGRAWISEEPELLARMTIPGEPPPLLAIVIEAEEVFFQFAGAFNRSKLWQPDSWLDRATLPASPHIPDEIRSDDRTVETRE